MADSLIPDTSNDCYPALVVFDLDACCWCVLARARSAARDATLIASTHRNLRYPEMYMMSSGAPFRKTGDLNVMESCKGEAVKLLGMTRPVWALLVGTERFRRTRVAVASRCDEPAWARELLKMFEAEPGVSFWDACDGGELCEIYKGSKKDHFRALQKKTNIAFDDMLFFDDDPARARASAFFFCVRTRWNDLPQANIRDVSSLGVVCVLTPRGVTGGCWEQGLRDFAKSKGRPAPILWGLSDEPPADSEPPAEASGEPRPWYKA